MGDALSVPSSEIMWSPKQDSERVAATSEAGPHTNLERGASCRHKRASLHARHTPGDTNSCSSSCFRARPPLTHPNPSKGPTVRLPRVRNTHAAHPRAHVPRMLSARVRSSWQERVGSREPWARWRLTEILTQCPLAGASPQAEGDRAPPSDSARRGRLACCGRAEGQVAHRPDDRGAQGVRRPGQLEPPI